MSDVSPLLALPAELIDQIFTYLTTYEVFRVASTCRLLHRHSLHEPLWHSFIDENLQTPISSPYPASSFRDLYIRHHPYWFLTRHQIWYSDAPLHGKLVFTRYEPRTGCIEGYTVVAERGPHEHGILSWHNQVLYDTFRPKVKLDLNQPILRLDLREPDLPLSFGRETPMHIHSGNTRRITSVFVPTRPISDDLKESASNSVWPPLKIPSPGDLRTRNQSPSSFNALGHKPESRSQFSDATFRIRQWIEYSHFMPIAPLMNQPNSRVGEVVYTYGTLPKDCYEPTKEKPWQGIWCGDYGGHGCEFLLVTQRDDPLPLPAKAQKAYDMADAGGNRNSFGLIGMIAAEGHEANEDFEDESAAFYGPVPGEIRMGIATSSSSSNSSARRRRYSGPSPDDKAPYKGRLEAIKLTGDPNVPRGEYTFIAPDIGANGLVGHASEAVFNTGRTQGGTSAAAAAAAAASEYPASTSTHPEVSSADLAGARIVRGVGHIAGTGFSRDTYIPTQLIMINENRLAQYWLPFRHVSFFERVDFAQLAAAGS